MQKYLTMWQIWATVALLLAIMLFFRVDNVASLLPFAILLICPLMMLFMMGGHKHK